MNCRVDLNEPKIIAKVTNNTFGLYAAQQWKKLINPYTPRDTGQLEETAKIKPWIIIYDPSNPKNGYHYARKVYYGVGLQFQTTNNPYATHHWDKAAEQAGKKTDLYRELNAYLHK